jgi:hypothetical protein
MPAPSSRQELIDYCLRSLGAPVLEINVDDDQVNDRIDEAFEFWNEYHMDATLKTYRKVRVTEQIAAQKYVDLPDSCLFVTRVWPLTNNSSNSSGMWSARYQMHLNDVYDLQYAGALVNYVETRQFLEMLDMLLNGVPPIRFNRHMNRMYIDIDFAYTIAVGDWIIVEAYETIEKEGSGAYTKVYNDIFLKKYATALIKRQWGQNMSKFEGMQLPGGVTMNGMKILEDANAEIAKLEADMELRYAKPVDFFIG